MSLFWIALRSIQQRGVASVLTMISMALGVMLIVAVLTIHGVVSESFMNDKGLGYNMIIGAKGGQEQLVLNMVYYLSAPVENVAYPYYLEFLPQEQRDAELKNSYAYRAAEARRLAAEAQAELTGGGLGAEAVAKLDAAAAKYDVKALELGRNGKYAHTCSLVIPVCLGDFFERFRVVGTTPQFFDEMIYDVTNDKKYEFVQGRNFVRESPEHGFFECVVGATVAREAVIRIGPDGKTTNDDEVPGRPLKLGDTISPRHGAPDGHEHARRFTIVGILKPTGTPNDRAVFVNMEGFYLMEDHAKPLEEEPIGGATAGDEEAADAPAAKPIETIDRPPPLPYEQREITGMLIRTSSPFMAPGLQTAVNEGKFAQAVFPIAVIYRLFENIVNPIQTAFLVLTSLICAVSGISILVSIYNSMSERRHEIAVMRALGADRLAVMLIILAESTMLALGGGAIGWLVGHTVCAAVSPMVEERTGVAIGFFNKEPRFAPVAVLLNRETTDNDWKVPTELAIIPGLLLLAVTVGLYPALQAYRTDVARSLGK